MCHDTIDCIVTGGADLVSRYRAWDAIRRQHPSTRHRSAATRKTARPTRPLEGAFVTLQILYRDWEGACDTRILRGLHSHDTTGARLRHAKQRARHDPWKGPLLRYKFCIVTGRGPVIRASCAGYTPVHACDTTGEGATTRPNLSHDTAGERGVA